MAIAFYGLDSLIAATEEGVHGASFWGLFIYIGLVLAIVIGIMSVAKKSFGERIFKKWPAQVVEQVYVFIEGLCIGTIGPHGRKYVPMIMTFWLVIFAANIVALFMSTSPTADLSFTLAMAVMVVAYVQIEGVKANGIGGHMAHFAGPKLVDWKNWKTIPFILITILLLGIELISEFMKNISLSLRLFGNIDGGHQAAATLNDLMASYLVPLGAFLMPIKLLTAIVQALIFCLLTCVYLSMVTQPHAKEPEAHAH